MPKRPRDANQLAAHIVALSTGQIEEAPEKEKNPAAVALGKLGGSKGGKARSAKLTGKQRSTIASKAAKNRWRLCENAGTVIRSGEQTGCDEVLLAAGERSEHASAKPVSEAMDALESSGEGA